MVMRALFTVSVVVLVGRMALAQQQWQVQKAPLMTRWAKDVSAEKVHPEYPRPQPVRQNWQNLNGLWSYAIQGKDEKQPANWQGQILVPFPAESALSGVMKTVGPANRLWYQRTFDVPAAWQGQGVLSHFCGGDSVAGRLLKGEHVGRHVGGSAPFSFDSTEAIRSGKNAMVMSVCSTTWDGFQPLGKHD